MAAQGANFHGLSVLQYAKDIANLARKHKAQTMLDYGCGRGDAYRSPHKLHHQMGIQRRSVTLYDPSFPVHSKLPTGRYDIVLCSDVLEHVPEEDVDALIGELFAYAKKVVWASVCCRPAKKVFPDGTNLHVTVRPYQWWESRFAVISRAVSIHMTGEEDAGAEWHLVGTP